MKDVAIVLGIAAVFMIFMGIGSCTNQNSFDHDYKCTNGKVDLESQSFQCQTYERRTND